MLEGDVLFVRRRWGFEGQAGGGRDELEDRVKRGGWGWCER